MSSPAAATLPAVAEPACSASAITYLDYAATTPVDPAVVKAMEPFLNGHHGNPSSIHRAGEQARAAIEKARGQVAALVGTTAERVIFTSGGTEGDNLAIKGSVLALRVAGHDKSKGPGHVITVATEHKAVIEACHDLERWLGMEATILKPDPLGRVSVEAIAAACRPDTMLVSVMYGNNETGTIQPIAKIAAMCRERGILVHCDGVQAVGQVPISFDELGVDFLALCAHKFHGPKGVGALIVREGAPLVPLVAGGGQEGGRRGGTENTAGIVGLGAAAEIAMKRVQYDAIQKAKLRDRLWNGIVQRLGSKSPSRNGALGHDALPGILHVSFPGHQGQRLVWILSDKHSVCVSAGSACTSDAGAAGPGATSCGRPSHVLVAMGLPERNAIGALRFSVGRDTTNEDVDRVLDALESVMR